MYSRISKLLALIFLASIISYLFYFNPQSTVINFSSESKTSIPTALALIISFFSGVVITTLIALYLGLMLKFEKWKIEKKLKNQDSHYLDLQKVSDLISLNDTAGARSILNKIISKDKTDTLARLSLSKTYNIDGEHQEAIKILEQARADQKRSPAILLELASSFEKSGNKSAALDNILLCLKENPKSSVVLAKAVELAEQMGRLEEAEKHALDLLKICPYQEQQKIQEQLAKIKLEKISPLEKNDPEEFLKKLNEIIKIHKDFEPALIKLAQIQIQNNQANEAIKSLQKAIKKGKSFEAVHALVTFWFNSDNPNSAISLLKEITSSEDESMKMKASLLLAQMYLKLENLEETDKLIQSIEDNFSLDVETKRLIEILKVKLESKIPGRSKTNSSLEKLILSESKKSGVLGLTQDSNTQGSNIQGKNIESSKSSLH